jgi:Zn-dependent peptidase ImmA (M78 family)
MTEFAQNSLSAPRWEIARNKADDLTKNYSRPPIPVLEIAEQAGVDVVFVDFGSHSDAVAGFCDFEQAKLFVNRDDKFGRQMFTIAHELGHWILHKDFFDNDPERYRVLPRFQKPRSDPYEQEANCFAAEMLVPKRLLKPVIGAGISSLADIFGVSKEMIEFRVKNVSEGR